MREAVLGIDIGTSGCKALLLGRDGGVIGSKTTSYVLAQPRPGWTEQDPALWVEGASSAVRALVADCPDVEIVAIGLSGQMHGLTALDADHKVLRPAPLWNDQRNLAECEEIVERAGGPDALRAMTNNQMLIGYTGGKILWMRNHEPALYGKLRHVLNPKDYIRLVLTGEIATEVSDASGTGLFDVRKRLWSGELLEHLEIDPALLPTCHESQVVTGRVSASGSALFGLKPGIAVVGGGGDSVIQTLGSGVIAPGELQTTIGTAGIVASALDEVIDNPGGRLQVFCNVAPDKWHCMGVTLNAGFAMTWFQRLISGFSSEGEWSFEKIVATAEKSPTGSRGLLFLPYLNGERCPHSDPQARGAFIGLTGLHGAPELSRSLLEGVTYALYDIFTLMEQAGLGSTVIKASGGGAKSPLWRQMQADLFGCEVVTTEGAAEGAAFGAAMVAGVGAGIWADAVEAARTCRSLSSEKARTKDGDILRAQFSTYQALYPVLTKSFGALSTAPFQTQ